ncbi:MAG: serine/threonine protein kinase [Leptolyngbya sp. DLM2.Bin15]|nr:MAG: serine/threonine protein kinase [Leptolyngbya sp. DLM2.Bin15]
MSYCLNPLCLSPQNLAEAQFCQSCGMRLQVNNRYRAIRPLGHGGFGKTYLAVDEHIPSRPPCVIKQFFPGNLSGDRLDKATHLFHEEANRLDHLSPHPQIPHLLAHFSEDRYHYLVQSFVDGQTLEQEVAQSGPFTEAQIRHVLGDLLPVLAFIHQAQVIHRDIKPANIIRRRSDRQLVLVDFGAAKLTSAAALQQTGTVIGSAGYAAPEQTGGKAVFASDLYSLGVTCIHLLTDVPPFDLYSFTEGTWIWRDYLRSPIHSELGLLLDRMLQPAISQRYQSAQEAIAALRYVNTLPDMGEDAVLGPKLPPPPPPPSRYSTTQLPDIQPTTPLAWRCVYTLEGHANSVAAIATSPNGKLFASGSFDRTIKLWHLGTGALVSTFEGHLSPVLSVVFSLDGRSLISGSVDDSIRLWDVATGQQSSTLTDTAASVMALSVEISPDGQALVSGSDDHTVKIWHLQTGRLLRSIRHPRAVSAVDISPDGKILVSGSNDNIIWLWNFSTGELMHKLTDHQRDINSLAISPDSKMLASGSSDNTIKLWDLRKGRLWRTLTGHLDWVRVVCISPDGRTLASGGDDCTIKLWDLKTGRLRHTLASYCHGHHKGVNALAFSRDNRTLISGSGDRTIKIWRYQ